MRRPVIIIAAVIAVIGIYLLFVAPLSEKRDLMKEALEAKYSTLKKYEAFLQKSGETDTELNALTKEIGSIETNALHETNESLAFAKLQGHVQDFAEKAGVKIISIRPLSVVKYKHYAGLPIRIEAGGGINQLSEFMKQLDSTKLLIKLDSLNVSVMNIQMPGELKIRMQVSGLMLAQNQNGKT